VNINLYYVILYSHIHYIILIYVNTYLILSMVWFSLINRIELNQIGNNQQKNNIIYYLFIIYYHLLLKKGFVIWRHRIIFLLTNITIFLIHKKYKYSN